MPSTARVPGHHRLRLAAGTQSFPAAAGGVSLLGGSPLRRLRLTVAGRLELERLGGGAAVGSSPLARRLLAAGLLVLDTAATTPKGFTSHPVTAVVPVLNAAGSVAGLVADLLAAGVDRVLVVDDGSSDATAAAARAAGADVCSHSRTLGPGAARTTGLARVQTDLVLFIDADCRLPAEALAPLLAHLEDPAVAAAAPRLRSAPGASLLARYESDHSPLDLGPDAGPVRPRSRLSYVPAAALLARCSAVRAVGGFAAELRYGEDVDLVWRLVQAGWEVRYDPASTAWHAPRASWAGWVRQRVGYGSSAGPLSQRHPGVLRPLPGGAVAGLGWLAAGLWTPAAALLPVIAVRSCVRARRQLRGVPVTAQLGLTARQQRQHLLQARDLLARGWSPLLLLLAVRYRRPRRLLLLAALVPLSRAELASPTGTALRFGDGLAYALGVWRGCLSARTMEPLLLRPRRPR